MNIGNLFNRIHIINSIKELSYICYVYKADRISLFRKPTIDQKKIDTDKYNRKMPLAGEANNLNF